MIPVYYEFQNSVKLLSGKYAIENLPSELEGLQVKQPMILSDQVLEKLGILQLVIDALLTAKVQIKEKFTRIPVDSSLSVIHEIVSLYLSRECDGIIAIGGGSVIDTAKGVRIVLSMQANDILQLSGCDKLSRGKHIPFVVIPTTSGTGSECTSVAVIKDELRKVKLEFISNYVQPDVAILDVRMTQSLPPKATAATGIDALCHAIESYTCLQKNPLSDAYATTAVGLIRNYLVTSVKDGNNQEARLAMANASSMAGIAFSNSMVGLVHAIGHSLGGICNISHGEAMSILLPACMEYNLAKMNQLYGELLLYLAGEEVYLQTPKPKRGIRAIAEVRKLLLLLHRISGIPIKLSQTKVMELDYVKIAKASLNDGAMIVNPKHVGLQDVINILKKVE